MTEASRVHRRLRRWAILPAALLCMLLVAAGPAVAHQQPAAMATVSTAPLALQATVLADAPALDDHAACRHGAAQGHHSCSAAGSCQPVGLVQDAVPAPAAAGGSLERRTAVMHHGRAIAPLFHPPKSPRA